MNEHRISIWDASIVAAAEAAGCARLYTEDLKNGATMGAVVIVNPLVWRHTLFFLCSRRLDPDLARPRPIEFRQVNPLPCAQLNSSPRDQYKMGLAEHARFDMGSRIPFPMFVPVLPGNDPVQRSDDVGTHRRIGILIYGDPRRRVRHENMTDAIDKAASGNGILNLRRNFNQATMRRCAHFQFFMHRSLREYSRGSPRKGGDDSQAQLSPHIKWRRLETWCDFSINIYGDFVRHGPKHISFATPA
jgi:hypothetical protein